MKSPNQPANLIDNNIFAFESEATKTSVWFFIIEIIISNNMTQQQDLFDQKQGDFDRRN